ncbi:MAG TPA: PstS family phosphate ABC transporter substrate-binding protein [Candidatus Sulfomarinibacteraceae bacterium]|nr:PstS family phosphate ABC transporter substrate-binding protein [Candidatus Sulfomarinibacteraceae bacterium]
MNLQQWATLHIRRFQFAIIILTALVGLLLVACGARAEALSLVEATPVPSKIEQITVRRLGGDGEYAGDEAENDEPTLPPVDPLQVEGDIVSAGSSTVYPLIEAVATQFESEGYRGRITIDSIGSGAGFERFCVAGETDLSTASRPINSSEVESCRRLGREPIEFRVGTDALAIAVNRNNDFVDNVSLEEVALLFSTARTWSDVRPQWPDERILRYIPGTDSGTYDYFVEVIFDENQVAILNAANLEQSEDDNVLVQGVLGSPYAVTFFGYAYYQENATQLRALSIGDVEPSADAVERGDYALSRPLYIYSTADIMQQKPQVAAFVNYFLSRVDDVVADVGYFPASREAMEDARLKWVEAMEQ